MDDVLEQLPHGFEVDAEIRSQRLRRQLDGALRQLQRRIDENERLAERIAALEAEVAMARQQYDDVLRTKTFRLADKPRRIYARLRRLRASLPLSA